MIAEVNGTRLYYEVAGSGHPLVLIHGSTLDTRMWDEQFEVFARSYRVIRYDARGFGKSALPAEADYVPADDLNALLGFLGIARAHLLGLSMGGAIAINLALTRPRMTGALILVDARPEGWHASSGLGTPSSAIASRARENRMEEAKRLWLNSPLFAPARERPAARSRLEAIISDYSGWHWVNRNPVRRLEPPALQRLEEIMAPTLILVGERDLPDFHAIAETMRRRIPNARKTVLPAVGHLPPMEDPGSFNQIVLSFLREISGPPGE